MWAGIPAGRRCQILPPLFVYVTHVLSQAAQVSKHKIPSYASTIDHTRVHIVSSSALPQPWLRRVCLWLRLLSTVSCHYGPLPAPSHSSATRTGHKPFDTFRPSPGYRLAADPHPTAGIRAAQARIIIAHAYSTKAGTAARFHQERDGEQEIWPGGWTMVSQACYTTSDGSRYSRPYPLYFASPPERRFPLSSHDTRALTMTDHQLDSDSAPQRKRIALAV